MAESDDPRQFWVFADRGFYRLVEDEKGVKQSRLWIPWGLAEWMRRDAQERNGS